MPWLDHTAAVVQAWYPGGEGAEAIADVLFGEVNPSGRLPVTFPASTEQLPRKRLDGSLTVEPDFLGNGKPGQTLDADHDIEGSDVGYRWFARTHAEPLFPFGFGLSYTQFAHDPIRLAADGLSASVTVRNTGARAGADVAQVYLAGTPGGPVRRLAGFARLELAPGESKTVTIPPEPRIMAEWVKGGWHLAGGNYRFALGSSASELGPEAVHRFAEKRWTGSAPAQ
jgi:beta-glucosidase